MHALLTLRRRAGITLLLAASALLTACGGGSEPTPPPVPGTLAVTVGPATLALVAGASGATTASITRGGSFSGDVSLTAEGAPTGVTVSFGTAALGAGVTSSTVAVTTAGSAAAGSYPIAIKATGTGVTVAAATLTLTVTAAATPTVAVSVAPTTASILAGASGTATATIVRGGGFTDAVSLTATGAPTGMTVTFTPASIPAGSTTSALAIAVGGTVAAGSYPIVVTAAGTGVTAATATLTVVVTVPAGGSAVTLSYCAADAPIWVAFQDGNGAWTRVTATTANTYSFTIASGRAGVATVDTVGSGFDLNLTYATVAEFNGFGNTLQQGACGTKTLTGTVANVAQTQFANVSLGYASAFVLPITSSAFTLRSVATGPQDLFASRLTASTQRVDRLILRRALNIADGGVIPVLDFNAAEAFAPATANVTLSGLGADTASIITLFNGTRGSTFGIIGSSSDYLTATGAVAYDAVPSAQLNAGELQQLYGFASTANSSTSTRFSGVFFRGPTDRTLVMGAPLGAPTVTRIAGGTYSRTRVELATQSDYNRYLTADFTQTSANRSATIFATTGYTSGAAWDLSIPDLTAASGWTTSWGLLNGTAIDWSISALGGAIYQLDATVTDGSTFKSATRSSTAPLP